MSDALKRLSDLFIEGAVAHLGDNKQGEPFVVWVQKPNAFEREEALRDATVRRSERMAELGVDSPEIRGVEVEMSLWTDDEVREAIVQGQDDDIYLEAMANLQVDPKFRELEDYIRRAPMLIRDDHAPDDDPRLATLTDKSSEYTDAVTKETVKVQKEHFQDLAEHPRTKLEKVFLEQWRHRRTFEEFVMARRLTDIYLATRECRGQPITTDLTGTEVWDHAACDHSQRLFASRESIRKVADQVLSMIQERLNDLTINARDAGNSDALASSSAPSEQSSAAEAPSTASTPAETSPAALTT